MEKAPILIEFEHMNPIEKGDYPLTPSTYQAPLYMVVGTGGIS